MIAWDVVVVGAGPAGSLAAREMARLGATVLLLDRSDFPREKVCGGCLSSGAMEVLASVGLGGLPDSLGAEPLRSFVVSSGRRSARLALTGGRALSRAAFDHALIGAARELGVEFRSGVRAELGSVGPGHRVVHLGRDSDLAEVRATVVLDATGLGGGLSRVTGGADSGVSGDSRIGLGASFDDGAYPVERGHLRMAVAREGYVGLVRGESGALNVAAAVDPGALRRHGATPASVVADILSSVGMPPLPPSPSGGWKGTPHLTRYPERVGGERVFRVGDAAGYVEPFTGEGMCWAMSAAIAVAPLAAEAVRGWRPDLLEVWGEYQRTALGRARRLCRALAPALRRPGLVQASLGVLGLFPSLAAPMVRRAGRRPRTSGAYAS